jgi:16S rRNA (cytosine1402-N4)-methyltransferase
MDRFSREQHISKSRQNIIHFEVETQYTESLTAHVPVMSAEIMTWLALRPGQRVVDGTFGGGGHARVLAAAVGGSGLVIGIDRDPQAIERARQDPGFISPPIQLTHASYDEIPEVLAKLGIAAVDAVLLDLGMSSDQLNDHQRGFSFTSAGPLDLRFDARQGAPAWQLLERLHEDRLADLIYELGEERYSRRIARAIVERRRTDPIRRADQLAELVFRCYPKSARHGRIHPATRTFQALRIAVNDELEILAKSLSQIPDCLVPGGRLAVLSFHSLEDRIVKSAMRGDPRLKNLTKKPVVPTEAELAYNSRSRSAKLRVAERLDTGPQATKIFINEG